MKKAVFFAFALIAMGAAVFANGSQDENGQPLVRKTMWVSSISKALLEEGLSKGGTIAVGVYPPGTSVEQVKTQAGVVAGAAFSAASRRNSMSIFDKDKNYLGEKGKNLNNTAGPYTITAWLFAAPFTSLREWTGSGTYDVFVVVADKDYYVAKNVTVTSAETWGDFNADFEKVK